MSNIVALDLADDPEETKKEIGKVLQLIQDDPLKVFRILWPKEKLAKFQEEVLYSYWFNKETNVAAGNMLGKDYLVESSTAAWLLEVVSDKGEDR